MVARKFIVHHQDSNFDVDYDTEDGFEVFKFQLFSLTTVPPDHQKILAFDDDRIVSDDSDLVSISDKLRLVSISDQNPNLDSATLKSDEELARMLQEEEDALMLQQFAVSEDNGQFEQRVRPYVDQILMYEDSHRQEAARKTVPVEKLEEKALVALAKEGNLNPSKPELDHAFLLQLLFWFKQTFKYVICFDFSLSLGFKKRVRCTQTQAFALLTAWHDVCIGGAGKNGLRGTSCSWEDFVP